MLHMPTCAFYLAIIANIHYKAPRSSACYNLQLKFAHFPKESSFKFDYVHDLSKVKVHISYTHNLEI